MGTENKVLAFIHDTAVIAPGAHIAKNVEIGPYSVIGENVEIGEGTKIGPHVVITGWTQIGKDCKIFQGASIGEEPQDLKFRGEKSYVFIGDRTTIREGATVHRATGEGEETRIGNDCLLMALTHVAHNCVVGNNVIMSNLASLAGHAIVEDRAVIGGMAGVHQFVKIGAHAMVGFSSAISQDVPPFIMADGNPAAARGFNVEGLRRRGFGPERIAAVKAMYRQIYRAGLTLEQAVEGLPAIEAERPEAAADVQMMRDFLAASRRGIVR